MLGVLQWAVRADLGNVSLDIREVVASTLVVCARRFRVGRRRVAKGVVMTGSFKCLKTDARNEELWGFNDARAYSRQLPALMIHDETHTHL